MFKVGKSSGVGAALLAWLAISAGLVAAQTIKLKVAYPTTVGSMAVIWVAKEAKLFEKQGLEVELIYVAGSSRVVQAMLANENSLTPDRRPPPRAVKLR